MCTKQKKKAPKETVPRGQQFLQKSLKLNPYIFYEYVHAQRTCKWFFTLLLENDIIFFLFFLFLETSFETFYHKAMEITTIVNAYLLENL